MYATEERMFNGSRALRERIEALEKESANSRRELDALNRRTTLDWEELLDKVRRWMQRTGARERAEAREEARTSPAQQMPLTDPVSAKILARRARSGGGHMPQLVPDLAGEGEG